MRKLKKYKPTPFKAKDSAYSKEAADYAVALSKSLHTKGTWPGNFNLIDWQEQIIRDVFGTQAQRLPPVKYRLHRNSKEDGQERTLPLLSPSCSAVGWRGAGPSLRLRRRPASSIHRVRCRRRYGEDESGAVQAEEILASQKRIIYQPHQLLLPVLSAEAYSKHGFNIHSVVFERAAHPPTESCLMS